MAKWSEYFRRGEPAVWFTGTGLGICLLMIAGMLALILINGLGFFWPKPLISVTLKDGSILMGELVDRQAIPAPGSPDHLRRFRVQLKLGNRDLTGQDFRWIDEDDIASRDWPSAAVYVERREYGPFIGTPVKLVRKGEDVATVPIRRGRRCCLCRTGQPRPRSPARSRTRRDRRCQLRHRAVAVTQVFPERNAGVTPGR